MKLAPNRLAPNELSPEDFLEVDRFLGEVFGCQQRPALVNAKGEHLELPEPVFYFFEAGVPFAEGVFFGF